MLLYFCCVHSCFALLWYLILQLLQDLLVFKFDLVSLQVINFDKPRNTFVISVAYFFESLVNFISALNYLFQIDRPVVFDKFQIFILLTAMQTLQLIILELGHHAMSLKSVFLIELKFIVYVVIFVDLVRLSEIFCNIFKVETFLNEINFTVFLAIIVMLRETEPRFNDIAISNVQKKL